MCIYKSKVNYIYKQSHIDKKNQKILYSFIETYSLTNDNPYGRSLSSRRHPYMYFRKLHLHVMYRRISPAFMGPEHWTNNTYSSLFNKVLFHVFLYGQLDVKPHIIVTAPFCRMFRGDKKLFIFMFFYFSWRNMTKL